MANILPMGLDSWTSGAGVYGEEADRIRRFIAKVKLKGLCDFASRRHNMVRKIEFDDGVHWVAKLRMPPSRDEGYAASHGAATEAEAGKEERLMEIQSEIATMDFVREHTRIPIPILQGYNMDEGNPIGCAFILMDYIHGNTASYLSRVYPGNHEGIPPAFQSKFWQQIGRFMSELATLRLPRIGSIFHDAKQEGAYNIGPLMETHSGPYFSTDEFYSDFPLALGRRLSRKGQETGGQQELIYAFLRLCPSFAACEENKDEAHDFGLANYDLNPNNVLVDAEFNVLAVIDWDRVASMPDAALHRFPYFMGIAGVVPGHREKRDVARTRQKLGWAFAQTVEEESHAWAARKERMRARGDPEAPVFRLTTAGFFGIEALAFRALMYIKNRESWMNTDWIWALRWLEGRSASQVARFCERVLMGDDEEDDYDDGGWASESVAG